MSSRGALALSLSLESLSARHSCSQRLMQRQQAESTCRLKDFMPACLARLLVRLTRLLQAATRARGSPVL